MKSRLFRISVTFFEVEHWNKEEWNFDVDHHKVFLLLCRIFVNKCLTYPVARLERDGQIISGGAHDPDEVA